MSSGCGFLWPRDDSAAQRRDSQWLLELALWRAGPLSSLLPLGEGSLWVRGRTKAEAASGRGFPRLMPVLGQAMTDFLLNPLECLELGNDSPEVSVSLEGSGMRGKF